MCGTVRYRDAVVIVPATCHASSSELHRATSAKRNILYRCYEFMVHQTVDATELFDCPRYFEIKHAELVASNVLLAMNLIITFSITNMR
jgi:hypothetical protein